MNEYEKQKGVSFTNSFSVIPKRFERLTHALEGRCSIQLSYGTILNCAAKVRTFIEPCKKNKKKLQELFEKVLEVFEKDLDESV